MPEPGYVYVLTNPEFPSLLKIGRTTRAPEVRAQELSSHTGVPFPYVVRYSRWFSDHQAAERYVHTVFADKRVRGKEFFRADLDEVIAVIEEYQPHMRERASDRRRFPFWRLVWVAAIVLFLSIGLMRYVTQGNIPRTRAVGRATRIDNVDIDDAVEVVKEEGNGRNLHTLEQPNPILDEVSEVSLTESDDQYAALWSGEGPSLRGDHQERQDKTPQLPTTPEKRPENPLVDEGVNRVTIEPVAGATSGPSLDHVIPHASGETPEDEVTTDNSLSVQKSNHATKSSEETHPITVDEGVRLESGFETAQGMDPIEEIFRTERPRDKSTESSRKEDDEDDSDEHISEESPSEDESNDALGVGFSAGTEQLGW